MILFLLCGFDDALLGWCKLVVSSAVVERLLFVSVSLGFNSNRLPSVIVAMIRATLLY